MNIALPTLIVLVILLPGLVYRRFYFTEEFSKQYFKSTFLDVVISSIFPAFLLQLLWFFLVQIFGVVVDLKIIGELLTAKDFPQKAFENIQNSVLNIGLYHLSILIAAGLMGRGSKMLVRSYNLDTKYKVFRFKNYWHYILKGEFFNFPRASFDLENDKVQDIELIYIDALVDTQLGSILYEGILVDYELSNDGGLEQIQLKETYRKILVNNNTNPNKNCTNFITEFFSTSKVQPNKSISYRIPGHIMVLPYKTITNLNFSYYKLITLLDGQYDVQLVN